jgi:hypothetical protein
MQLREDLEVRHRRDRTGDAGGGGRRQARNVPALLPATDTLAAGVVDESLPSVGRHGATTAMGERARRRGGRRAAEDADGRGWEAAAREGLGWEAAAREEGLGKVLGHRWEGGGGGG